MTIVEALKVDDPFIRVTYEKRYLVWSTAQKSWEVWQGGTRRVLAVTKSQHTAVEFLLGKRQ